jgi:hypothetical protein
MLDVSSWLSNTQGLKRHVFVQERDRNRKIATAAKVRPTSCC